MRPRRARGVGHTFRGWVGAWISAARFSLPPSHRCVGDGEDLTGRMGGFRPETHTPPPSLPLPPFPPKTWKD